VAAPEHTHPYYYGQLETKQQLNIGPAPSPSLPWMDGGTDGGRDEKDDGLERTKPQADKTTDIIYRD